MATYHVCDICGRELSASGFDNYFINLGPTMSVRELKPSDNKFHINKELCGSCASYIYNCIKFMKDVPNEENKYGR